MEKTESTQPATDQPAETGHTAVPAAPHQAPSTSSLALAAGQSCPTCTGSGALQFVYALGRIQPRFPSVGIEKEFAQATSRADTKGLTDRQALQAVLSESQNRYLVSKLCWVLTIEGLETYILVPRNPDRKSTRLN